MPVLEYRNKHTGYLFNAIQWDGTNNEEVIKFCKPKQHKFDEENKTLTLNWDFFGNILSPHDYLYQNLNRFVAESPTKFEEENYRLIIK